MGRRGPRAYVARPAPTANERPSGLDGGAARRRAAEAWAAVPPSAGNCAGYFDLLWGPDPDKPAFANLDEMRSAWERHRDELLKPTAFGARPGWRPWSFWHFDQAPPPDCETESEAVWFAVPTDQAEIDAIEAAWLQATRDSLARHPRDRAAAERMALADGDVPSWAFNALIAEGMARPPSAVVPIAPRRRKRRRRA